MRRDYQCAWLDLTELNHPDKPMVLKAGEDPRTSIWRRKEQNQGNENRVSSARLSQEASPPRST